MNSVDEVKVLTGTLPAEYGHSTSGVITTVKKSGTQMNFTEPSPTTAAPAS